jgi:cytochrome c-type biogenesis protein CcmH/NrfG
MNPNAIACPTCQANLRLPGPQSGEKQVRCPQCGTAFVVSAATFKPALGLLEGTARGKQELAESAAVAPASRAAPTLIGKGMGLALIGAVVVVGAGIIVAIVLTRGGTAPEQDPPVVRLEAPPPQPTVPDDADKIRHDREKHRPDYLRLMIAGGTALNARRYDDAVTAYDDALKHFPDDAEALRKLGEAREGRLALAAQTRHKDEQASRDAAFARSMDQGRDALAAGRFAVAVQAFQQALQLKPADASAAKGLAEAQTAAAAAQTDQKNLAAYQSHMTAGQAAAAAGRYADAIREYLAALQLRPGDAAAMQGRRLAETQLAALQDQEKRKIEFARLVDQGGAALRNQRFQEAIDSYSAALKLFKGDPTATQGLADAQQGLQALQLQLTQQLTLGDTAMRTGRYADAVVAYREALRLAPANALAVKGMQDAQAALDNLKTAQVAYLQFMTQGAAALRTQRFADAVQAYTAALRLVPNDPDALQGLRDAQAGLGGAAPVAIDFDRELQRGLVDLQQKRFGDAIKHFKRALKVRPDSPQALQGLSQARYGDAMSDGRAAMNARRYAEAVRSFEDALREMPGDFAATTALRQARALSNFNPPR